MEVLRIALLGKRGAGKSSAGNTLLGSKAFYTAPSLEGVTQACSLSTTTVDRHKICVVDTPGWTDSLTTAENKQEIVKCIDVSDPGPHVFLLVLPISQFTTEEINTAEQILKVFGEEVNKYIMLLFTRADIPEGKTFEEYLESVHPDLKKVTEICGGRYHVFSNSDKENSEQVSTLLEKIKRMVERNEGRHYTKAMFEKTEEKMEEKNIPQRTVEECRKQIKNSAVESNDGSISRKREEGKLHRDVRREREPYLEEGEGEGENTTGKLNQDTKQHCEKDSNEEEYMVHIAKPRGGKSHSDKSVSQSSKSESHGTAHNKTQLKWQKTVTELQRSIEKIEMTWSKEKGGLEKEIHQLRKNLGEQKTELEKVKKELQLQQGKVQAFEKLRQEGQQQRKELQKLVKDNEEDRQKMKRRNSALQKHLEEFEKAIDGNKETDLKTTLQTFMLQLKKNVLLPK